MRFTGNTYVAFSDLCGFKQMMKGRNKAYEALDFLFNTVYRLQRGNHNVNALAVSDCVISWAVSHDSREGKLKTVIEFVEILNRKMARRRYLMRTTIAWGDFEYEDRIQLRNLQKSMIWGGAYLDAYMNNKKAQVGKILLLNNQTEGQLSTERHVCERWKWKKRSKGWEYIWAASSRQDIARLKSIRANRENKYEPLKELLYELVTAMPER
ncbi:MAG: hypothetical protein ACYTEO_04490 [Planctomycetota bacterium]|jgi:hypothetical protein